MFRWSQHQLMFLLVHPGGPFWAKKDEGAWSIPKGEFDPEEDPLSAAIRELQEETGAVADGPFIHLSPLRQKSGKIIHAWACEGDFDLQYFKSNLFKMEWPPRSGKSAEFPEVDKAGWFSIEDALVKLSTGQHGFIHELIELLNKQDV